MRLLMLHGYAQNDEILQAKSRRFIGYMQSAYPHAKFIWANGPVQLHPGDVTENSEDQNENSQEGKSAIHFRAWFHQHVPGASFQEVSDSLAYLAELLQTYGPFDGVVGFSQGSIMAVLLASLLQGDVRRKSYDALPHSSSDKILPYPREFFHLAHPPLKFGILFCPGLLLTGTEWLWGGPALSKLYRDSRRTNSPMPSTSSCPTCRLPEPSTLFSKESTSSSTSRHLWLEKQTTFAPAMLSQPWEWYQRFSRPRPDTHLLRLWSSPRLSPL
jgi:hypothetical protein